LNSQKSEYSFNVGDFRDIGSSLQNKINLFEEMKAQNTSAKINNIDKINVVSN